MHTVIFFTFVATAHGLNLDASINRVLSRRSLLLAPVLLAPAAASASYAMTQANENGQTWQATSKEAERAVYESIGKSLEEKRRFSEEAGTLGYVGGEYTNYRRGAGRDKWEEEQQQQKKKKSGDGYARAEDLLVVARTASRAGAAP